MNKQPSTQPIHHSFKRSWILIIILIVGLVILSFASTDFINKKLEETYQSTLKNNAKNIDPNQIYTEAKQSSIEGKNNVWNVFGSANPKITIVEFGEFTCPYCEQDFPIVRAIMIKHADIVKFIWRDRPPTQRSLVLSLVAQCAGAQGKFWPMHDKLFQNQSDTLGNNASDIMALAESINLDMTAFRACLAQQTYLSNIKDSLNTSITLGISGTPTFFINGQEYTGTLSESDFEAIINELK